MSDIEGIKEANETGFALLAVVQGAREAFRETANAAGEAGRAAEAERVRVVTEAQAVYQAVQREQTESVQAVAVIEGEKVNAAKQAVSLAEDALRKHEADTKAKYGTSLDFLSLVSAPSGGRVRL